MSDVSALVIYAHKLDILLNITPRCQLVHFPCLPHQHLAMSCSGADKRVHLHAFPELHDGRSILPSCVVVLYLDYETWRSLSIPARSEALFTAGIGCYWRCQVIIPPTWMPNQISVQPSAPSSLVRALKPAGTSRPQAWNAFILPCKKGDMTRHHRPPVSPHPPPTASPIRRVVIDAQRRIRQQP